MSECKAQRHENEITLQGELSRVTVPALWQQRQQWLQGTDTVTLNFAGVEKVDSAGVAMLIAAQRELLDAHRALKITHATAQLRAMVQVSGVESILELNDSMRK